jgi:hypothetical protein
LALIVGLGATLAVLSGCSTDPSTPGGDAARTQAPAQLPDGFPAYAENSDSTSAPPGCDPSVPPIPGERGGMWVRFRAFNDASRPDVGLWILREGRAAAMSLAEGPPAHHAWITPDTLRIVAGWFETAGFRDLTQRSYFTGGEPGRICEIFLSDSAGVGRRVIGDEAALPEPVRLLARDLEGLAMHILLTTPDGPPPPPPDDSTAVPPGPPTLPPALRVDLAVRPPRAPAGTPRTIRLTLLNETPDTVTLRFRSSRIYDLVLVKGRMQPPPLPDSDSTWVPPDSGVCPGGTIAPLPPDSTGTPFDRLVWNWAHDRVFEPGVTTLVLAPGGNVVCTETWDGKSNEGETVGPGRYVLAAPIFASWPVTNGMVPLAVTGR